MLRSSGADNISRAGFVLFHFNDKHHGPKGQSLRSQYQESPTVEAMCGCFGRAWTRMAAESPRYRRAAGCRKSSQIPLTTFAFCSVLCSCIGSAAPLLKGDLQAHPCRSTLALCISLFCGVACTTWFHFEVAGAGSQERRTAREVSAAML